MFYKKRDGFSLIEIMTVIAIIGILMAMIFPIMASSKKRAKQAQCINNLYQVYTAVKQFQLDEHRYPDFIAGPRQLDGGGNVVPLERTNGMVNGRVVSVYPEYINAISGLRCPMASLNATGVDYTSSDIIVDPMNAYLTGLGITTVLRAQNQYNLYRCSSYDYQEPRSMTGEVHYSTAWCADMNDPNVERQLRWRMPPADTVITWCSFHRGSNLAGSKDLVLWLDGHVKPVQSESMATWFDGWTVPAP